MLAAMSLFTLVGIAGEDDLDAPDLNSAASLNGPTRSSSEQNQSKRNPERVEQSHSGNARLKGQLSAVLRDELVGELKAIGSADAAAIWARRILPAKNSLNVADARRLENAFQTRLAELERGLGTTKLQRSSERKEPEASGTSAIERIEKTVLRVPSRDESAIESM